MRAGAAALVCGLLLAAPVHAQDWKRFEIDAGGRLLAAALGPVSQDPAGESGGVLTVVVEGDGRAHVRGGRPSDDPTPAKPVGLAIARAWTSGGQVAWLGRLCQYTRRRDPRCRTEDWTVDRFAEPAISASNAAIDDLKARTGARRIHLVGWSGGGVIAAALAHRRSDVVAVTTMAAPLDVAGWTQAAGLSPLTLSPDVAALAQGPLAVPQLHLLGENDGVTPPAEVLSGVQKVAGGLGVVEVVPEGHNCCWAQRAPQIAARTRGLR